MVNGRRARARAKKRRAILPAMVTTPETPHVPYRDRIGSGATSSLHPYPHQKQRPLRSLIPQLLLASININGLTPESEWAVTSMLETRGYDVSYL